MKTDNTKPLSSIVRKMRRLGIVHLKLEDLELVIGPEPAVDVLEKRPDDDVPPKKKGADGLTAEEQKELYGAVMDAEE